MLADSMLCTGTPCAWLLGNLKGHIGRAVQMSTETACCTSGGKDFVVCSGLCVVQTAKNLKPLTLQIATDQVARALKVTQGALIQAVAPKGAAETAGLQPTRRQALQGLRFACSRLRCRSLPRVDRLTAHCGPK